MLQWFLVINRMLRIKQIHESDSHQYLQINEIIEIKLIKYINKYDSHEINKDDLYKKMKGKWNYEVINKGTE